MPEIIDMVGKRVGRLVVQHITREGSRLAYWMCQCDCGNTAIVAGVKLRSVVPTQSCGCLQKENTSKAKKTHGQSHKNKSAEYKTWVGMKNRCYNSVDKAFDHYGAKGVIVCDRWKDSFENFLADMGIKPSADHSIDRIDNAKGYSPENCRWVTKKEQANNKTSNHLIEIDGVVKNMTQWCEFYNTDYHLVKKRIYKGMDPKQALIKPSSTGGDVLEFQGVVLSLPEHCRSRGLPYKTVHTRIHKCGWSIEHALTTPVAHKINL